MKIKLSNDDSLRLNVLFNNFALSFWLGKPKTPLFYDECDYDTIVYHLISLCFRSMGYLKSFAFTFFVFSFVFTVYKESKTEAHLQNRIKFERS